MARIFRMAGACCSHCGDSGGCRSRPEEYHLFEIAGFNREGIFTQGKAEDRGLSTAIAREITTQPCVKKIEREGLDFSKRWYKARSMEINARLDAFIEECSELVLEWDTETARTWGRLAHTRAVKRQPQSLWDSLIDAMAVRHGAKIASRNGNDFRHAIIYNPWTGLEHLPG